MIKVGDIVEHTVYGCGMVEQLFVVNDPTGDRELATLWLFENKERDEGRREQAVVNVRFLKPFVAYVET
jgi:hypothetical protein